jgi:hypothetical protein
MIHIILWYEIKHLFSIYHNLLSNDFYQCFFLPQRNGNSSGLEVTLHYQTNRHY